MSYYRRPYYCDEPRCYGPGECEGCDACTEVAKTTRVVAARAPRSEAGRKRRDRNGIRPGDKIKVTTGFHYQRDGGPRLGYFGRRETLVEYGPNWTPAEIEARKLSRRTQSATYYDSQSNRELLRDVEDFEARHPHGPKVVWPKGRREVVIRAIAKTEAARKGQTQKAGNAPA